jgi:ribosomal protein S18 acetylase RimI-like enzyme
MVIDSVWTDEEHRGKGYGTKLIEKAIKLAISNNVDSVELVVNSDNIAAKKLYEKVGFEKTNKDYYRLILNGWKI